jgi:hypothetical protein
MSSLVCFNGCAGRRGRGCAAVALVAQAPTARRPPSPTKAAAGRKTPPRTSDGKPNLQGI